MARFFRSLSFIFYASVLLASTHIDRLYVFGDSYSDTGAGYIDGNGPTAVAYLAQRLRLTMVPTNAPDTAGKSLNFAVSGAGTGSGPGHRVKDALLGLGMRDQVADFVTRVHSGSIKFLPDSTLFFIAGGLNDKRLPTETTVANLETEVRMLYGVGGRRFLIALLPTAIPAFSQVGQRLDPAIARIPSELSAALPDASIHLSHWGDFYDEVMHNPAKYGITDTADACAGRAIFNQDTTPCPNPAAHFYYHSGHPSTAVHKIVGNMLYDEVLKLPPPL
ncbi:MAG TPA: SGNH/GDSL hydrolase family protein [Bryobacteraceae bacterium]|jgi:phospholipase/lecithinase/hemolysin|nr:SGNH/GDSL hydrolase family protein [Bryobacteraceae bacterium]